MPAGFATRKSLRNRKKIRKFRPGYDRTGGYYRNQGAMELKFHDYNFVPTIIPNTSGAALGTSWNLIPTGTTESTRIGRKVTIKSIGIKASLELLAGSIGSDSFMIAIVLDKQCNGANALFTDVYENVASHNSFRNLANNERFQVLKTWRGTITTPAFDTGDASIPTRRDFRWFKKCNIPIEYSGITGAIGEIRSNNIQVFAINPSSPDTSFSWNVRLRFTDN